MKKGLLVGIMATVIGFSSFNASKVGALTQTDIIYKEAYEATLKASSCKFDSNSAVDLQKIINEARNRINELKETKALPDAIPTFSDMVDKPQEKIFQLMIQKNDEMGKNLKVAPVDYIYTNQTDINFIRSIIIELIRTEPHYALTFSYLCDIPQQQKINRAVEKIGTAKKTKFVGDILTARECVNDLLKVVNNDGVYSYVQGLDSQVKELEKSVPNKEIGNFNDEIRVSYKGANKVEYFTKGKTVKEWSAIGQERDFNTKRIVTVFYGQEKQLGAYKTTYLRMTNANGNEPYIELVRLADGFVIERIFGNGKVEKFNPSILNDATIQRFNSTSNFLQDGWYKGIN